MTPAYDRALGLPFEFAADQPGIAVGEPGASLGTTLMLPRRLEPRRSGIEEVLHALA